MHDALLNEPLNEHSLLLVNAITQLRLLAAVACIVSL